MTISTLPSPNTTEPVASGHEEDRGVTIEQATGMLGSLQSGHTCGTACIGEVTLGDGRIMHLTCPYQRLNPLDASDRRVIASIYAIEARTAFLGDES